MKAEFHIHTRYSNDSILNKYLILLMCKIKKINYIAITDHNEIKGAIEYKKKLSKYRINVIIGEEILTSDGEIIGLFLKERIEPFLSVKETIQKIKKQNGLVYVPHPYDEKRIKTVLKKECIEKYAKDIDLIEIHNGRNIDEKYDIEQKNISDYNNILPIIGSDAHIFWELGRNFIMIDKEITRENAIDVIKSAKFETRRCIKFSHIITKYVKCFKMICKGDISGIFRIINKKCKRKEYRTSK